MMNEEKHENCTKESTEFESTVNQFIGIEYYKVDPHEETKKRIKLSRGFFTNCVYVGSVSLSPLVVGWNHECPSF